MTVRTVQPRFDSGHQIVQAIYAARMDPDRLQVVVDSIRSSDRALDAMDSITIGLLTLIAISSTRTEPKLPREWRAWVDEKGLEELREIDRRDSRVPRVPTMFTNMQYYDSDTFDQKVEELGELMNLRAALQDHLRRMQTNKHPELRALFGTNWWPPFVDNKASLDLAYEGFSPARDLSEFIGAIFLIDPDSDTFNIGPLPEQSIELLKRFCLECLTDIGKKFTPASQVFCQRLLAPEQEGGPSVCWDFLPEKIFDSTENSVLACLALKHCGRLVQNLPIIHDLEDEQELTLSGSYSDELVAMPPTGTKLLSQLKTLWEEGSRCARKSVFRIDQFLDRKDVLLLPDFDSFCSCIGLFAFNQDYRSSHLLLEDDSCDLSLDRLVKLKDYLIAPLVLVMKTKEAAFQYSAFAFQWPHLGPFFRFHPWGIQTLEDITFNNESPPQEYRLLLRLQEIFAGDDDPMELGGSSPRSEDVLEACQILASLGLNQTAAALAACWIELCDLRLGKPSFPLRDLASLKQEIGPGAITPLLKALRRAANDGAPAHGDAIRAYFPQIRHINLPEERADLLLETVLGETAWSSLDNGQREQLIQSEEVWMHYAPKIHEGSAEYVRGCLGTWFSILEDFLHKFIQSVVSTTIPSKTLSEELRTNKDLGMLKKVLSRTASFNQLIRLILEFAVSAQTHSMKKTAIELEKTGLFQAHFRTSMSKYSIKLLGELRNKITHEPVNGAEARMCRLLLFEAGFMRDVILSAASME